MEPRTPSSPRLNPSRGWQAAALRRAPALVVWAVAWPVMEVMDHSLDVANLALVLVLASAVASLWLAAWESIAVCALAVMAFNWQFVPPRGTFTVDLRQHALLLMTAMVVGSVVAVLMARQRALAARALALAQRADVLRTVNEALRDAAHPLERLPQFEDALCQLTGCSVAVWLSASVSQPEAMAAPAGLTADQLARLEQCQRDALPFGPGTARTEGQTDLYLPVRGKGLCAGGVLIQFGALQADADVVATAQALCDQLGLALERAQALQRAQDARDESQLHKLRNTMLSAISHDYRTPLATILGAASSLQEQGARLSDVQRQRMLASIVDEVQQLNQLTDNTLQLVRLDATGVQLHWDWESAEDIVASVAQRMRQRHSDARLSVRIEPGLPLLRCDAVLLVQLLNNLVDNALKYAPSAAPIEVEVRKADACLLFSVADRGPGVPLAWRERIFEVFQRGDAQPVGSGEVGRSQRGAGVGLAVCRAIARAHGGTLTVRSRKRGGTCFECRLPVHEQPAVDSAESSVLKPESP